MKFQLIVRGLFNFLHARSANFKKRQNNTMKNATRYCYFLITGCAQQTFTVQKISQHASSTKGNHHPSFLRFWNWAERKP